MFDLETHITTWREELAATEGILSEDLDEMEDHLRLQMETLQIAGLAPQEAFWVGRRRLGETQSLAEEFSKVNRAGVWRQRLRWMLIGYLAVQGLTGVGVFVADLLSRVSLIVQPTLVVATVVYTLLMACIPLFLWLAVRQGLRAPEQWARYRRQRGLWLGLGVALLALLPVLRAGSSILTLRLLDIQQYGEFAMIQSIAGLIYSIGMPLIVVGLVLWLGSRKPSAPQVARG